MKKIILIALLVKSILSQAQLKYYDIVPDIILRNGLTTAFDTICIRVAHDSSRYFLNESVRISIGNDQAWTFAGDSSSIAVDGANEAEALLKYAVIDGGRNWWGHGMLNDGVGNWVGVTNRYLGIRVQRNGKTHYGWIRMDVDAAPTSIKIKDYAINLIPEIPIKAGQTPPSAIERPVKSNIALTITGNSIHLSDASPDDSINLTIYNLLGEMVCHRDFYGNTTEIGFVEPGVYVASLCINGVPRIVKISKTE